MYQGKIPVPTTLALAELEFDGDVRTVPAILAVTAADISAAHAREHAEFLARVAYLNEKFARLSALGHRPLVIPRESHAALSKKLGQRA